MGVYFIQFLARLVNYKNLVNEQIASLGLKSLGVDEQNANLIKLGTGLGTSVSAIVIAKNADRLVDGGNTLSRLDNNPKTIIENNINSDNPSLIHHAVREFVATQGNSVTHRAENVNLGQTIDRDGLTRVDKAKEFNDDQVAANLGLGSKRQLPYHPTGYPAWKPGTEVVDRVLDKPERMRMVIDEKQKLNMESATKKGENPSQYLGGWATQEPINSITDMRQRLAVTEGFKPSILDDGTPNKFYVVEFEVQAGVGIREGIAGTMYDGKTGQVMPGGVKQINFVKESAHTDPDKFIIDFNSIKEIK